MAGSEPQLAHVHLGRFELVHRLEVGGMAEIFIALERAAHDFERIVVIKKALPHLANKESFREMFLREAQWVARLNHPNIVQIYELGEHDGASFIAMEHVPGLSFRDLTTAAINAGKSIPLGVVIGLMSQACAGAHAAHELRDPQGNALGLVHRDISPHNLMVTAGGHVKLLDFGIAKATELGIDTTRTGALKGKVHYMAPEQVLEEKLDRRSDVFALAILTWELLTLRRLFKKENDLATMKAITGGEVVRADRARSDVPPAISAAVMKGLAVKRDERWATADEFRRALEQAADGAGLKHGVDEVAAGVNELLGATLKERERELKEAVERVKRDGYSFDAPGLRKLETQSLPSVSPHRDEVTQATENGPLSLGERVGGREQTERKWPRRIGMFLVFALSVGASAAWVVSRLSAVEGAPLRMGWAPTIDPRVLAEDIEPMRKHVEEKTRRPVEIVYASSYRDLGDQLLDGGVEFAAMPPALFVRTEARDKRIKALALKLVGGSSGTDGILVATEASGIAVIADLKGKTLCVPDLESTTGMLFPQVAAKKAGLEWEKDVTVVVSGNHLQVLRDVTAGKCTAGATYSAALLNAVTQGVEAIGLRQVAITGHSPQDSIVAGPGVSERDGAKLLDALLSYKPPPDRPTGTGSVER
ncbi:MAG: PhnD/SsuA/transferrin family substrate-binding protein, partial [Archangium sp.]|nr:PhnD/SsuA/transferrin family substrate-binding protein [Archangium sp.]